MNGKSEAVVGFLANLLPLYDGERHEGLWCARSLIDGTRILPIDESDSDDEQGWVRVQWQGDPSREQETRGDMLATVALDRYVRLQGAGYDEEAIAGELWFMARHFHFKTGCDVYLPQLKEPPSQLRRVGRVVLKFGGGVLVNAVSKLSGVG
ncbi:hypothetical protein RHOFW104T7_09960 [Rhodanobacter thiooxydans]|uniref:Uncharacterized protein n=1 Tax=Rhodanobacter thiooxydans TaxID=416169 RepID=A0A154QIZ9_9GAMM|nr:hypothetical protein [Rhodanobacter thiooxydans]EIL99368.1 hypothetical protein UUA_10181 [Rhodanobacter thiooxydans LCS2]KZC24159.1 hypothetical protein RHOFW104T7_09960 [Rhodanobacter thiooxydans]MCW0203781.1 hypothetical protein [Rhodanobacter thiooxydans]